MRRMRNSSMHDSLQSPIAGSSISSHLVLWRRDRTLLEIDMPDPASLHVSLFTSILVAEVSHDLFNLFVYYVYIFGIQ